MNFNNFRTWVYGQPAEKYIDHSTWQTCAVGDYLASQGYQRDSAQDWSAQHLPSGVRSDLNLSDYTPVTYGELSTYLLGVA